MYALCVSKLHKNSWSVLSCVFAVPFEEWETKRLCSFFFTLVASRVIVVPP